MTTKVTNNVEKYNKSGYIEYKMPEKMAQAYLSERRGEDAKMHPNDYLCRLVNETFGLKGYCTRVIRN